MARPPTAMLVLLSCTIPLSVGHLESSFEDRKALFQHVLLNDQQWSQVINQKVNLSQLKMPRFDLTNPNDKYLENFQLLSQEAEKDTTPKYVILQLMQKTPWLGTNVNYAAYALSAGITCFTYNNVSFVLSLVVNRIGKLTEEIRKSTKSNDGGEDNNKDSNTSVNIDSESKNESENQSKNKSEDYLKDKVEQVLGEVRDMLVVFVDKVAAMGGELTFLINMLRNFETAEIISGNSYIFKVSQFIIDKADKKFTPYCHTISHEQIYQFLGKYENLNAYPSPPDTLKADDVTLNHEVAEFKKIVDCMMEFYDRLNIKTLPMQTWFQILDYRFPTHMEIKSFVDKGIKVSTKPEEILQSELIKVIEKVDKKKKKKKKKSKKKKH